MKIIVTSSNYAIKVDDEDFEFLTKFSWYIRGWNGKKYASRRAWTKDPSRPTYIPSKVKGVKRKVNGYYTLLHMHRIIMNCPDDKEIDHIDGDGLNNQKSNLRIVTHQENMRNVKVRRSSKSGHTGVSFDRQTMKWRATITRDGAFKNLGRFNNIEDAILARKTALMSQTN